MAQEAPMRCGAYRPTRPDCRWLGPRRLVAPLVVAGPKAVVNAGDRPSGEPVAAPNANKVTASRAVVLVVASATLDPSDSANDWIAHYDDLIAE
jgi:hypothetical protein